MRGLFPLKDLYSALREQERGPTRRQPAVNSPALVGGGDTIGSEDCWCGRPQNHDWPMKSEGAPHPRYPE